MKGGGGGDPKEKIGSANEKLKGARIRSHAGGPFQQLSFCRLEKRCFSGFPRRTKQRCVFLALSSIKRLLKKLAYIA